MMTPQRAEALRLGVMIREGDGTISKTRGPYSKPVLRLDAAGREAARRDLLRPWFPPEPFDMNCNRRFLAARET